ncbi:MAG: hypothetical protein KGS44_05255 [Alphaproteobacteria bacterium]|nr:hypothetical protein [Alphaproteobacteria bacterium]
MAEASLLFVREDRAIADRLARALEAHGVSMCASASAYEDVDNSDAAVALFSSAAVKSTLLMERALAAEAQGKLVPVFVGFCHLQAPLNKLALHDLCEWNGEGSDIALQAIRAHVMRIARARSAGEILKQDMRAPEPEPPSSAARPINAEALGGERGQTRGDQDRLDLNRPEPAQQRAQEAAAAAEHTRRHQDPRLRALGPAEHAPGSGERAEQREGGRKSADAGERMGLGARNAAASESRSHTTARPAPGDPPPDGDVSTSNERSIADPFGDTRFDMSRFGDTEDGLRRERAHREREIAARRMAQAAAQDTQQREYASAWDGLGDPFGSGLRPAWRDAALEATFEGEDLGRRPLGLSDWASDVLVMTIVALGAMAAVVIPAQPDAAQALAVGLQQEVAALVAGLP